MWKCNVALDIVHSHISLDLYFPREPHQFRWLLGVKVRLFMLFLSRLLLWYYEKHPQKLWSIENLPSIVSHIYMVGRIIICVLFLPMPCVLWDCISLSAFARLRDSIQNRLQSKINDSPRRKNYCSAWHFQMITKKGEIWRRSSPEILDLKT